MIFSYEYDIQSRQAPLKKSCLLWGLLNGTILGKNMKIIEYYNDIKNEKNSKMLKLTCNRLTYFAHNQKKIFC